MILYLHFIRLGRCSHLRKPDWQRRLPRVQSRQWWLPHNPFMTQIPYIRTSSTVGSRLDIARILEKNPVAVVMGLAVENPTVQGATMVDAFTLAELPTLGLDASVGSSMPISKPRMGPGSSTTETTTTARHSWATTTTGLHGLSKWAVCSLCSYKY